MLKRLHHLIQSHLGRGGAALLGGLALLHVGLCLLLFDPKLHTGGDSATYMLLAESIATAGDGYSLHVDPGPPVAHTKYPPGYPLALAPLVALFGRNLVVLKLLSVVFTAASVVVFGLMTRRAGWLPGGGEARPEGPVSGQGANGVRETGEGGAAGRSRRLLASPWFWLALAFAVSPGVIDYSRWMLSEAPFLLVTLFALWMMREDEAGPASRAVRAADGTGFRRKVACFLSGLGTPFWLALGASVAAFYVRTMGALLLVAASLCYLWRRDWRRFLVHGAIGVGLTGPWVVRSWLVTGSTTSYFEEFALASMYVPEQGRVDLGGLVERVLVNAWDYAAIELPRALAGSQGSWAQHPLPTAAALLLAALALVGAARGLRRRGAPELYVLLTGGVILLYQNAVADVRYLVPLLPMALLFAARGLALAASRLGPGRRERVQRRLAVGLGAVLVAVGLGGQAARAPGNVEMLARHAAGDAYAGYTPGWRNFFEAMEWIRDSTPEDAAVVSRKPRLLHAVTGRRSVIYPFSTHADSVLRVVRASDYVLVDQLFASTRLFLLPALQTTGEELALVYADNPPATIVLGVVRRR